MVPTRNRQRVWLRLAAAASFVVGLVLVFNDSGAGWFLIIMGITYLGASTRPAQEMAATNRGLARWGLVAAMLLLLLLAIVLGAVVLF